MRAADPASTDRPGDYRSAVARLEASQKDGAGVPAYLRWINRGIGRRAAAAAFVLGLSPNAVTTLSALLSLTAMIMIAAFTPSLGLALIATLLLLAGYALDSADGQLARLTGTGTIAGEWLDHVIDAARLPLFHLAIAIHFFRADRQGWITAIAVLFLILSSIWFFAQTLADKLGPASADGEDERAPVWVSFAKLPYDLGVLYLTVAFLAMPQAFSVLYSALFVLTACIALLSLGRKYRALVRASAPASSDRTPV